MKKLVPTLLMVALLVALAPQVATAQTGDGMQQRYDDKLAEPFLEKAQWLLDYDEARVEAKKTGKAIFVYFTRSYAP